MTLSISSRNKQAASAARRDDIDLAATPGKILYYPDPRPAPGATASGLLVSMTLTDPCGTVDSSGLHLTSAAAAQAVAAGIIRWARVVDGDDNYVMDGDVRMVTDTDIADADFVIDAAQVYVGSFVNLISATLAEGG